VDEVAVGLLEHGDARGLRVTRHLLEAVDDALHHLVLRLLRRQLVAEHADVGHAHRVGEIDEAAALVELLLAGRGILLVHARGRAEVGHHDADRGEVLLALREP
jgi:hypothetical protein